MSDPRRIARLTGVLWLVVIAASVVSVVTNFLAPVMGRMWRLSSSPSLFWGKAH